MDSSENVVHKEGNEEDEGVVQASTAMKLMDYIPIYIPAIETRLIDDNRQESRFLDFLDARPSKDWFINFGFVAKFTPLSYFCRNPSPTNESPHPDPAADLSTRRFRVPFVRKINWGYMIIYIKNWMKVPANLALFIWLIFVVAGLLILFLVMLGLLNQAIPSSDMRKKWQEVLNQILNALFTIMCLYQHPALFHHLVLLCRWKENDMAEVRKVYCKDGLPKPNERRHMLFVVILFHFTCFVQYVMCGFYWGFPRATRPDWAVNTCVVAGTVAPVVGGVYLSRSPLGRRYEADREMGMEPPTTIDAPVSVCNPRVVVTEPEWIGGLFNCWDDPTVFFCSFFCTFCVFGWNMERLGFGDMYVHIFTFLLLCVAPVLIFGVAALNVEDETIGITLGIVGGVLCLFGLLYGGVWRSEIRKKFKLPGNPLCCGCAWATDCLQWLFCWSCSLSQEVRTRNFYEIRDDSFYRMATNEEGKQMLLPLPRDMELRSRSCPPKIEPLGPERPATESMDACSSDGSFRFERASTCSRISEMKAPVSPPMQSRG